MISIMLTQYSIVVLFYFFLSFFLSGFMYQAHTVARSRRPSVVD